MSKDLYELADSVETEQDFLSFVEALMKDKSDEENKEKIKPSSPYGPGANGWENGDTFIRTRKKTRARFKGVMCIRFISSKLN